MVDDRYYRDQPRFERQDPLNRWAWGFLVLAVLSLVWFLAVIILTATGRLADGTLFGRSEGFWVGVSTVAVILSMLGLVFVIVGRLGATSGGGYLSADAEAEQRQRTTADDDEAVEGVNEDALYDRSARPSAPRRVARIDDPFGPDGRMLLSYTVPEQQPRGIYGDTWVPIDTDAVLNIKTLLAKTSGGNRP